MWNKIFYKILIGILTLLAYLPLNILYIFSDFIFFIVYYIVGYRRGTVKHNLNLIFGKSNPEAIPRIEKAYYHHMCDCIVETVKLLHISDEEIDRRVDVTNGAYIDEIVNSGHSVVLLLGHYGNWEWVQAIIHHFKAPGLAGQIYRPLHNPVMDQIMLKIRSRFGLECIPQQKAVRKILEAEHSGKKFVIGFISDQRPTTKVLHNWTDFLGQDTPYFVGGESIGTKVDAAFVYLDVCKLKRGYYRMTFQPIVVDPNDNEENPYTRKYMKMLEETILKAPEYWLWSHKRWKRSRNVDTANKNV